MLSDVAERVNIPIIASGGAGKKEDFLELFRLPAWTRDLPRAYSIAGS
jgi:imidazole glycerol phosphate synthase subunit HisF